MKLTDYETAKALKELGFDEVCHYVYMRFPPGDEPESGMAVRQNSELIKDEFTIPELHKAADFLREQYGVHVYAYPINSKWDLWRYFIHKRQRNMPQDEAKKYPDHDTALQEGIKKGVEIVKNEE